MEARLIAGLLCGSEADALVVRDYIAAKLAAVVQLPNPDSHGPTVSVEETVWAVGLDRRFLLKLDATALFDDLKAKWSSGPMRARFLPGSFASVHVCPHGTEQASCREARFELAEAVK